MSRRRIAVALLLGLLSAAAGWGLGRTPLFRTIELKLYDLRVRAAADPSQASRDIVLVDINEHSLRQLEPLVGRWPWPRAIHGALIDFLARAPARVVAYDVLFTDRDRSAGVDIGGARWTGEASDAAFAEAIARAGNVVLLADVSFEGLAGGAALSPPRRTLFEPRPSLRLPFAAAAKAAVGLGHNYFVLDPDGPVRRAVPAVEVDGRIVPSLSVATVLAAGAARDGLSETDAGMRLAGRDVPLLTERLPGFDGGATDVRTRRLLVDYRGPAVLADGRTTTYRTYSFYDLFYSEQQLLEGVTPDVDPAQFRDRIVIVGTTGAGLHDVFTVPFGSGGKMPGSQVHASIVDQLRSGRFIRPVGPLLNLAVLILSALAVAFVVAGTSLRWSVTGSVLAATLLVGGGFLAFARGWWIDLTAPVLAVALAAVGGLAFQYFTEGREKRQVKRLFSRYLSRDVYEQVLANPALAELGGRRREMSVLFSDIRGFTALTEKGEPEALVAQLNEYFSVMVEVVFTHRGTLDKFVGDMVMALFGAPLDDDAHADHAVEAALAMVRELEALNARWRAGGRPTLGIGIGINSGEMIAGNIGSERVRSYTVIGDNVNLASRLESLNKDYRTSIIVSEHTVTRLKGRYDMRPLGEVVVKGKSVPARIFEVRGGGQALGAEGTLASPEREA